MDINDVYDEQEGSASADLQPNRKSIKKKKKSAMRRDAEKYSAGLARRGVIYLSKVPPFMKPNKIKSLFEPYGEVTRIYLAEEDPATRKKRQMNGGNGSKQFKEGWIEFGKKKIARSVAESLNNTQIGSRKGDYYHDDIWNLKYLSGFKWDFLTEKFAYERRVREQKLNASMNQAKKQNAEMVQLIEKQHVQKLIENRKSGRDAISAPKVGAEDAEEGMEASSSSNKKRKSSRTSSSDSEGAVGRSKRGRTFHQAESLGVNHGESEGGGKQE